MSFSPLLKLNIALASLVSLLLLPGQILASSNGLVIDEYRVAGESTNDEYIVIANYGFSDINLSGYRLLKRAKSTTDYKLVDDFGNRVLGPGQKIIAAHAKYIGTSDYIFVTGTSNTIADNNSIFLIAPDGSTVDLVGYGDATYFETVPAPTPSAYEVYRRQNGRDDNNNAEDFVLIEQKIAFDTNADKLLITEIMPSPTSGEEWFELYNPTTLDVSLAGLFICDALGARHCYSFKDDEYILAGGYRVFAQSLTKITLNNKGDWLELFDINENPLTDSGGDYGSADKGISFALFGSEYKWTSKVTPGSSNVFLDIIEEEDDKPTVKKTKTKVATTGTDTTLVLNDEYTSEAIEAEASVLGDSDDKAREETSTGISREKIGMFLIVLAILLFLGYIGWYFKDNAKNIYNKFKSRNYSSRK